MEIHTLPSYREVVDLLDTFHNLERAAPVAGSLDGGSERMVELTRRLGSPQSAIPAVHIAGTKGKGSVSHLVAAALTASGIKTGLYTSPHVNDLRERIMINGRPVGEQRFVEACSAVLREAEAMRREGCSPSWFEILTATALVVFQAAKVEAMVLETGLGGRLDATNLPDARLVVTGLTAISLDHQEILGDTLELVAAEKAAIIRRNTPVVTVLQEPKAMRVIEERAREMNAPLFTVGRDVLVETRKAVQPDKPGFGQRLDFETWRNVYPDVPLAMLGAHQVENAGLALGLVDLFMEYLDRESPDALVLKRAWRSLALPGRLEVVGKLPWHVIDGAHNLASAWAAAETLLESFTATDRTLIFGVAGDKDYRGMLRILAPLFRNVVVTPFSSPRAVEPAELSAFLASEYPAIRIAAAIDPAHALELAEEFTPCDGLIFTAGSLYLAGEMRKLCREHAGREKSGRV
ncbi:MAG: bifunctional folylpolyglutamate synthase/dihydrofolate synthase [Planctomycetes bacterium]|nr:bifunctional folylpolyglutamate synthase/dihydrofolate synthase [Planctomycetota bacterium]